MSMAEPLWLAEDAAAATGGTLIGSDTWLASGVSIDTRSLQRGDLFVALHDQRNGHDFLEAAFAAGACAALVSEHRQAPGPCLRVGDTLAALRDLGVRARDRGTAKRIAITGSVGKTSTKEAIAAALSAQGPTHASVKSYNNHWGVPLTLARMPASSVYGVFEMGMNHRGEIAPLSALVAPDIAIVTWIAPAHIENLGSLEAIADEKGDVFTGLRSGGVALVPADAPHADRLLSAATAVGARVLTFGASPGCDARVTAFSADPDGGSRAEADVCGTRVAYRIGADGAHWAGNSAATLLAAYCAGADVRAAAVALAAFTAPEGRGQTMKVRGPFGEITLIDDSYNANPTSMAASLALLGARTPGPGGRRVAVLGEMLELGEGEVAFHAGLAAPIAAAGVDQVFCAGVKMNALWAALPVAARGGIEDTAAALWPVALAALRDGDVVLVKGSNGSKVHTIAARLKDQAEK